MSEGLRLVVEAIRPRFTRFDTFTDDATLRRAGSGPEASRAATVRGTVADRHLIQAFERAAHLGNLALRLADDRRGRVRDHRHRTLNDRRLECKRAPLNIHARRAPGQPEVCYRRAWPVWNQARSPAGRHGACGTGCCVGRRCRA